MARLDISTDRFLKLQSSSIQESKSRNVIGYCLLFVLAIIFFLCQFVLVCISAAAVSYANNNEVINACGSGLKDVVLVSVIFYFVGAFFYCIVYLILKCICSCIVDKINGITFKIIQRVLVAVTFLCLCIFSFKYRDEALHNDECMSALKTHSKDLGDHILTDVALALGISDVVYLFIAAVHLIFLIIKECRENPGY
jgi:hypothetical protein